MRAAALLVILIALVAPPAAAQSGSPAGSASVKAEKDPRFARFEAAVEEAKAAMMADPEQGLVSAERALVRAQALPPSPAAERALATAEWLKGEAYLGLNQASKAGPIIDSAIARAERYAPNTKLHGDLMRSRGAIAAATNVVAALRDYQRAHDIFRAAGEVRSQAIALQDIGQIYSDAGDYPRTLEYYSQATELYRADPAFRLTSHNNRAEVLRELKRYDEAERDFTEALKSARELKSPMLETRILSNLANAQVEHGKFKDAERSIAEALRLSRSGEAAGWKPIVLGSAAKLKAAQGDLKEAGDLLRRAFAGVDLKTTDMSFKDFHELAASVFEKLGDKTMALQHLKAFQRLDSESRNLIASNASQLMAARFDFQNQKQMIFERDARIKEQQAEFRTRLLLGLVGAAAIVLLLLLFSALRIRKSRNQVRATNVVLSQTNVALEKALKAKTEFLATTSHEIRTPLNGILGMTQILLTSRKLDEEAREQVEVVHGAGEAMRALVDDILDVAKMETGEVTIVREEVAFRRLLEETARLWGGPAAAKGVELRLDIAEAPARILSDSARIRQIVGNLLSNAVKFTLEGSVSLRSFVEDDDGTLVVEVSDTGVGIPEDHLERVFEAFHQVDGGMNRQFSGTGLGLSICRSLGAALGGTVSLESRLAKGSTFTLRLPLVRLDERARSAEAGAKPTAMANARVLLVEANAMTEGVMRSILEPVTASVDCVPDGAAAIAAIRAGTADHLLVEARSGVIAGNSPLAALRLLAEACTAANIPMSLLVAPDEDYPLAEVAQLGAVQLIVKPVGALKLIAALQSVYEVSEVADPLSSAA